MKNTEHKGNFQRIAKRVVDAKGYAIKIKDPKTKKETTLYSREGPYEINIDGGMNPIRVAFSGGGTILNTGTIIPDGSMSCATNTLSPTQPIWTNGGCRDKGETVAKLIYKILCTSKSENITHVDRVLTIAQKWGHAYWHFPMEALPGLADQTEWLKKNPDVKIHITEAGSFHLAWLAVAGIPEDRVVSGTVHADEIFVGRQGTCGGPLPFQVEWLHWTIRLQGIAPKDTITSDDGGPRTLLLIDRTKSRALKNRQDLLTAMQALANKFKLKFDVFTDSALGTVPEQLQRFANAALVVGSHGAGAASLVAADPGTPIVEIMDTTFMNLCTCSMASHGQYRYFGIASDRFTVDIGEIRALVNHVLVSGHVSGATIPCELRLAGCPRIEDYTDVEDLE